MTNAKKKTSPLLVQPVGTAYQITRDGKSVDGKTYRNLYVAQQALLYMSATPEPEFTNLDLEAAQLADDEQSADDSE